MATFFNYQILADRFVLNLKCEETQGAIFPFGVLLLVMREEEIARHLGPYPNLNSTGDSAFSPKDPVQISSLKICTHVQYKLLYYGILYNTTKLQNVFISKKRILQFL